MHTALINPADKLDTTSTTRKAPWGHRLTAIALAGALVLGGAAGTARAAGGDGTGSLGTGTRGGQACLAGDVTQAAPLRGNAGAVGGAENGTGGGTWGCPPYASCGAGEGACPLDADGDGICDHLAAHQAQASATDGDGAAQGAPRFVDADGDGTCDICGAPGTQCPYGEDSRGSRGHTTDALGCPGFTDEDGDGICDFAARTGGASAGTPVQADTSGAGEAGAFAAGWGTQARADGSGAHGLGVGRGAGACGGNGYGCGRCMA